MIMGKNLHVLHLGPQLPAKRIFAVHHEVSRAAHGDLLSEARKLHFAICRSENI